MITGNFAQLRISTPLLGLLGVAHTGIEAVMSHPENIFDIAIIYTDTYGPDFGTISIDGHTTIDEATYIYGIANVVHMASGGTPSIIFEVKNAQDLDQVEEILRRALAIFTSGVEMNIRTICNMVM